jgi:hypothetical protein
VTLEREVYAGLHPKEGTESFNLPWPNGLRATRAALQRLKRKGKVEAERAPDGAWLWFSIACLDCEDGEVVVNADWPEGDEAHVEKCATCGGTGDAVDW